MGVWYVVRPAGKAGKGHQTRAQAQECGCGCSAAPHALANSTLADSTLVDSNRSQVLADSNVHWWTLKVYSN